MTSDASSPSHLNPSEELSDKFDASAPMTSASVKKARRQTAFYPNMNPANKPQNPFSRSAAKRESVMTLGSIEHLQHYFTKTGIAAKQNPLKPNRGLVPAIGGSQAVHTRGAPSVASISERQLPPPPVAPVFVRPPFPHVEKTYETDPENLKPGVIADLEAVSEAWKIDASGSSKQSDRELLCANGGHSNDPDHFDVLGALKITTRAIRSVRNYLVSLPDDSTFPIREKQQYRAQSFTPMPVKKRLVSNPNATSDPLTLIRRSALDVLITLRALEESARLPLSDDAYDAQSDHGSSVSQDASTGTLSHSISRGASPTLVAEPERACDFDSSFAVSVVSVPGRIEGVPVWVDEYEDDDIREDENEKRDVWDERLILGGGWLYKQDMTLADLKKEQETVRRYLDTVDDALFGGTLDGLRGWEKAMKEREKTEREGRARGMSRRASSANGSADGSRPASAAGMRRIVSNSLVEGLRDMDLTEEPEAEAIAEEFEEDSVDDEDLPEWAKRSYFAGDPLVRAHALLTHLLPTTLLPLLPTPYTSRNALLDSLSSGQLLCIAYNAGVRHSRKPWGYINKDSVHDIAAIEARAEAESTEVDEKRKTGWTFRRTDNLRLWAAALKLRYMLPLVAPAGGTDSKDSTPTASPAPTKSKFSPSATVEPPVVFDARLIAKKGTGWEDILEGAVLKWVSRVVDEKRGDR